MPGCCLLGPVDDSVSSSQPHPPLAQSGVGLSPPGAATAKDPERPGEHTAGPWDAHHHQVLGRVGCPALSMGVCLGKHGFNCAAAAAITTRWP